MNYKSIFYSIGKILRLEAILLILPFIVSIIYKENNHFAFLLPIGLSFLIGTLLSIKKPKNRGLYAREGLLIVGMSWIILSLFGALPFVVSKEIPNFVDAFFETVSGFTTTGASILSDVEVMSKSILFWRAFTHWIGGMGVLVFILAVLPTSDTGNMHLLRAESTGPQVGKLVSKVKFTARILYAIYIALTLLEMIFLICGKMPIFDSIVNAFATAGTGGFAIKNASIGAYSVYSQVVIAVFMLVFGINFSLFYLILIGNVKKALKSEELRCYLLIILASTIIITINVYTSFSNAKLLLTAKDAFFQVTSIITTTGFATLDYEIWPALSKTILFILMFIGACAGSTGGGMKVSRVIILFKSAKRGLKRLIHPRSVSIIHLEKKPIEENVVSSVQTYFIILILIFVLGTILISIDNFSLTTNISAVAACINNIGPGFDLVGPACNYSHFSSFSKIVLSFEMLVGRLEIYPILMLFYPKTWTNK